MAIRFPLATIKRPSAGAAFAGIMGTRAGRRTFR
jgi:hypothetical protein